MKLQHNESLCKNHIQDKTTTYGELFSHNKKCCAAQIIVDAAHKLVYKIITPQTDTANQRIDKMNKATQEAVQNAETMMKDAQGAFQSAFEKASKSVESVNDFGKANMDAVIKSGEISSKAAETIGKELTEVAKKNFDETVKVAQDLASAKTVTELFEKQTAFAKTAFDTYSAQFRAISEIATKSTKEAVAPLTARAEAANDFAKNFQV